MIYSLNLNYIDEMEAGYRTIGSTAERIGEKVDDYFLVGANIRYAPDPNLYIDLKAENLFDEIYHYPANEVASMEKGLIGMGRVILLTVGYKF
jgi:outer membrane receptor protein involved in Fe transport